MRVRTRSRQLPACDTALGATSRETRNNGLTGPTCMVHARKMTKEVGRSGGTATWQVAIAMLMIRNATSAARCRVLWGTVVCSDQ